MVRAREALIYSSDTVPGSCDTNKSASTTAQSIMQKSFSDLELRRQEGSARGREAQVGAQVGQLCRLPPIRLRRRASTLCRSTHPILPLLVEQALTLPFSRLARRCQRSLGPNSCAVLAHVSRDRERSSVIFAP